MNLIKTYGIFRIKNNKIEAYCFSLNTKWSDKIVYFIRNKSINYFRQKINKFKQNKRSDNYIHQNVGRENYLKRIYNIHKTLNKIRKAYPKDDIFLLKINTNKPIKLKDGQYIQIEWKDRQKCLPTTTSEYITFVGFKVLNSIKEYNK